MGPVNLVLCQDTLSPGRGALFLSAEAADTAALHCENQVKRRERRLSW